MVVAPYLERKAEERERAAGVVVNPPIVVTHVLEGRWIGTFAGEAGASLVLEGPDSALMGDLWTPLGGGNQRHSRIEGVFDSQARRVVFRDVSLQPGAGAYVAMLDDDGVLQGQFRGAGADPIGFAFVPSPE